MSVHVSPVPATWIPYFLTEDCGNFWVPGDAKDVRDGWAPFLTITPPPPHGASVLLEISSEEHCDSPLTVRVSRETGEVVGEKTFGPFLWLSKYEIPADIPPGGSFVVETRSPRPFRWNGGATVWLKPVTAP